MFKEDEIVRVLTGAIMEILPRGGSVRVTKSSTQGSPAEERFCVQVDARDEEEYVIRVVPLTDAQRRKLSGRDEQLLMALVPEGWGVKIHHYRETAYSGGLLPKHVAKCLGLAVSPQGGETVVTIESPDSEQSYTGRATCAPTDNFCRAEGRTIALDRALRQKDETEFPRMTVAADDFPTFEQLRDGGYPDGFAPAAAGAQS